jgi:hypothetical protein
MAQTPHKQSPYGMNTPQADRQDDWAVRALREAIDADGRGVKRFAREILMRPPSTIYRWLAGSRPIPLCVRDYLVGSFRILSPPTTTKESNQNGPD